VQRVALILQTHALTIVLRLGDRQEEEKDEEDEEGWREQEQEKERCQWRTWWVAGSLARVTAAVSEGSGDIIGRGVLQADGVRSKHAEILLLHRGQQSGGLPCDERRNAVIISVALCA
jgi:hypothetical protein